jgi:hypothetical protein
MRRLRPLLLAALLVTSFANKKLDRLSDTERDHFHALKVWMDEKEIKAWLKLKTEDERNQWLKDKGYWNRFYQYDERVRQAILDGLVTVGWTQDRMLMAWGAPHERRRNTGRPTQRSETLVYRFEVTPDGQVLVWEPDSKTAYEAVEKFHYQVIVDDGVVAEMIKVDGWDD